MKWIKQGLVFAPSGNDPWSRTHAQVPTPHFLDDKRIRIYYGTRDEMNRTRTCFIDVHADDPREVLAHGARPVMELGRPGFFDDSGVMPFCVMTIQDKKYLYYTGWNVGTPARYRLGIGLAVSEDGGTTFQRMYDGPIMDRTPADPCGVCSNFVRIEGEIWRMWYTSMVGWEFFEGLAEPFYDIKHATSRDGINWRPENTPTIPLTGEEGGIARPSVIVRDGLYRLWYSYRSRQGYRSDKTKSYRVGYAESADGVHFTRMDGQAGIDVSESGWDSEMIAYPYVYEHKGRLWMLYNGNGFGKSGFGCAILEES